MKKTEDRSQKPEAGSRKASGGMRLVCMDCGAELPGSDPSGARTSHGLCRQDFDRRMAELNVEGRAA